LAFDLIFAEGQRRFLDCLSAYARQFVEQMARPEVDWVGGLPPTVSIEQRTSRGGGKSTVATVTEVHQFFRLLFARLGTPYCPKCVLPVEGQTREAVLQRLMEARSGRGDLFLLAPVVKHRKGFHTEVGEWAARHGYAEIRADGRRYPTDQPIRLDRFREHDLEVVIGVLEGGRRRGGRGSGPTPQQLVDEALEVGKGTLMALDEAGQVTVHSTERACPGCGLSFQLLDPKQFSYNSSQGWCPTCRGFGELFHLPEVDRGARADAIEESWWSWGEGERERCPDCEGSRLNPVARAVRLGGGEAGDQGLTMDTLGRMTVAEALEWARSVRWEGRRAVVARDILPEIRSRLEVLNEIGLEYLQLARSVTTLSGGEAQRIRLAAQLGSNLTGVLYVLDEPTIGLHARDNHRLLDALETLRGRGNSLIVVEHDEDTMRRADHVIDLGPGAGVHGGYLVAQGTLEELERHPESVTGQWLRSERRYPTRGVRRPVKRPARGQAWAEPGALRLEGARLHNLRGETMEVPLGRLVVVTGVSGSGKSTLVRECLLPALEAALAGGGEAGGEGRGKGKSKSKSKSKGSGEMGGRLPAGWTLTGAEGLKAVYEVDQSPIGRTPRSTPATYVGFFDEIRAMFAQVPEARMRGYEAGRFSFNAAAGRCPQCDGAGQNKLEMNFLPPAYIRCEGCRGSRFNSETLDIEYGGKNIAQVLDLSVDEALEFFGAVPRVRRPLEALRDTGLGYVRLGQTSPTLSGGEAQRVKLVTHLLSGLREPGARLERDSKRHLFLLEEPTIGLHGADVRRLVEVLQRLVDHGHSVVVIEHHLELIADADWVLDMGPEAGEGGGRLVVAGTPEEVAACAASHTGRHLAPLLQGLAAKGQESPVPVGKRSGKGRTGRPTRRGAGGAGRGVGAGSGG
jgi:excinuclease ABC subunit A